MVYVKELPRAVDKTFVDGIVNKSDETMIYITIAGGWQVELEEALDCLYVDHRREFELIDVKRNRGLIGALIVMKHKKKYSDSDKKTENDCVDGTRQEDDEGEPRQEA